VAILHRFPTAGRARPCGILAAACCLPDFSVGVVAGGVSRGHSGRGARGGAVVRFLKRAVLFEVGEDDADGGGLFAVGSLMLATMRSVPPQWTQVLRSMLKTRLRRCA